MVQKNIELQLQALHVIKERNGRLIGLVRVVTQLPIRVSESYNFPKMSRFSRSLVWRILDFLIIL